MIDENELTKQLMASIELEMHVPPYQMGVANAVVRGIVPKIMKIIKEEVRTARREHAVEMQKNSE